MEVNIKELTLEQLEAHAYRWIKRKEFAQLQINAFEQEIELREQQEQGKREMKGSDAS